MQSSRTYLLQLLLLKFLKISITYKISCRFEWYCAVCMNSFHFRCFFICSRFFWCRFIIGLFIFVFRQLLFALLCLMFFWSSTFFWCRLISCNFEEAY